MCFAISEDGILWKKPELGIVELHGNKRNNIAMRAPLSVGVINDLRESDPLKHYNILLPRRKVASMVLSQRSQLESARVARAGLRRHPQQ